MICIPANIDIGCNRVLVTHEGTEGGSRTAPDSLMPDAYKHLSRTDDGAVTTVTLARPDSHNALNAALIEELTRCFGEISDDDGVRVVVLVGRGTLVLRRR